MKAKKGKPAFQKKFKALQPTLAKKALAEPAQNGQEKTGQVKMKKKVWKKMKPTGPGPASAKSKSTQAVKKSAPKSKPDGASEPAKKKKKHKFRGKKSHKPNPARLPEKEGLVSQNWKALLKTIEADPAQQQKKRKFPPRKLKKSEPKEAKVEAEAPKVPDIWFDGVDEMLLDPEDRAALANNRNNNDNSGTAYATAAETEPGADPADLNGSAEDKSGPDGLVKERSFQGLTRVIGMDCEMVGVGFNARDSILARVSIVNHFGNCVYDKFVKPTEKVTDYRTKVSGVRPSDVKNGEDFKVVQKEVSDILENRLLVGHAIHHDMKVLFLTHPKKLIRDTSTYKPFRNAFGGKTPSLKRLTERMIGVKVQEGEHSSVQDAQAAVRLYTMFRKDWEKSVDERRAKRRAEAPAPASASAASAAASAATASETAQKRPASDDVSSGPRPMTAKRRKFDSSSKDTRLASMSRGLVRKGPQYQDSDSES